jgi:hypothetical protein
LSRALAGVRVRIIVWRHELVSHINRMLYMGEWSIDSEVAKLQSRCQKHGLVCKVFHTITNIVRIPSHDDPSSFAHPQHQPNITIHCSRMAVRRMQTLTTTRPTPI